VKPWQRFAAALTTATFFYGGQLRQWTDPRNRFLEHWARSDAWSIVAGTALLAAVLFVIREVLARRAFTRRLVDHVFVALLGGGMISTFLTYPDYKSELLYLALLAVIVASWCRPHLFIPLRIGQFALIFSPLAFIVSWQFVQYPEWVTPAETPELSHPDHAASPVFIFVCDEWSYARSTEYGRFLPLFKHLNEFAEQAVTFDFALSPGPRTDVSIPRLLWQRGDDLQITAGASWWSAESGRIPTVDAPNIFRTARDNFYTTSLLGFYLPYRKMLGDSVDYCHAYLEHPKPDTFAGKLRANALRNITFQHDPLSRRTSRALEASALPLSRAAFSAHWEKINRALQRETLGLIQDCPPNQFAFIHLPLPHCPWVFNPDGTYRGAYRGERMSHDVDGYRRHLAYLDVVLGQFFNALSSAGKFDNAMIIVTSDHSWRLDYTFDGHLQDGEDLRHVPLFIKFPGQHDAQRVFNKFELLHLAPILKAVMEGQPEEARNLLHHATP
jgi:hypothetical protein